MKVWFISFLLDLLEDDLLPRPLLFKCKSSFCSFKKPWVTIWNKKWGGLRLENILQEEWGYNFFFASDAEAIFCMVVGLKMKAW